MADNVRERHPEMNFISSCVSCPHMKRINLDNLETSLREEIFEVEVPEPIRIRALRAVERMLEMS